ncbi:MAG: HK97 family phage prohead protease [Thermoleophilia bacterium]
MSMPARPERQPATWLRRDWPDDVELRAYATGDVTLRESGEETGGNWHVVTGHAAVFETLSLPLWDWWEGEYQEQIARGAFAKVLSRNPDVHFVYSHDMAAAMARTTRKAGAGSLELREDPRGLHIFSRLDPEDMDARRLVPKLRNQVVDQMSFAFTVAADRWEIEENENERRVVRTVLEVGELYEVSAVPQAAYPATDVGLRSRVRGLVETAFRDGRLPEEAGATHRVAPRPGAGAEVVEQLRASEQAEQARRHQARRRRAAASTHFHVTRSTHR